MAWSPFSETGEVLIASTTAIGILLKVCSGVLMRMMLRFSG